MRGGEENRRGEKKREEGREGKKRKNRGKKNKGEKNKRQKKREKTEGTKERRERIERERNRNIRRESCKRVEKLGKNVAPPFERVAPLLGAAVHEPRHRHGPPPQHRQRRSKTPPLRQVTLLHPHSCFLFPFLHAERIAFCMQGWGEIIPPARFGCWARRIMAQPRLLGRAWPRRGILVFWAEIGPIHFGPKSAQHLWG
jgi:hypothetical protein